MPLSAEAFTAAFKDSRDDGFLMTGITRSSGGDDVYDYEVTYNPFKIS